MERYSLRTLDEMGRVAIHSELRQKLDLQTGDKLALVHVGTLIIVQREEARTEGEAEPAGVCAISELGQIEIPAVLRQAMGWVAKSKIAVYQTDSLIILQSA